MITPNSNAPDTESQVASGAGTGRDPSSLTRRSTWNISDDWGTALTARGAAFPGVFHHPILTPASNAPDAGSPVRRRVVTRHHACGLVECSTWNNSPWEAQPEPAIEGHLERAFECPSAAGAAIDRLR
jgi:hypothetical protein